MRRWFLSYHSPDQALAERLKAGLERKDTDARVFFAPSSPRAEGFWSRALAEEIAQADAFILLVGEKGIGDWQVLEYDEALDKRAKFPDFPVIPVLLEGQTAPGLPFLRQLHWVITADPTSEKSLAQVVDAAGGGGAPPGELWRYTSPYRGLAAMVEKDSDYFFGREEKTVEILKALTAAPGRLLILLGNSGVGKSSVAQAGVLAALKRQAWPGAATPPEWPDAFRESRRWCFLTLKPGTEPLRSLVDAFLDTWQLGSTDPEREKQQNGWIELLRDGKAMLLDLLDATERRYKELDLPKPPAFFLYVDQGEELYVRAEERQRRRFSEVIAQGVADPRLYILMSMRADFLGELQKDEPLYKVHRPINVPPLRELELREVVSRPAELLSARFESAWLVDIITRRAAEDSVKDVGGLPLLSYTLDDMWTQMVARADGVLRLSAEFFEPGRVLVDRANAFLAAHPKSREELRHIFTLKLAAVREGEEPTRRRATRSEFTDEEWRLVTELADPPNRLLVTATHAGGEVYVEMAHDAIFRRSDKLCDWIAAEREFLTWRTGLEAARHTWQATPDSLKDDALLMGLLLRQARSWISKRLDDIPEVDRVFIVLSDRRARKTFWPLPREVTKRPTRPAPQPRGTKVFISYRRSDTSQTAGRVYDWLLARQIPENEIFFDIDTIPVGVDFKQHISSAVSRSAVMLVLVGEKWLSPNWKGPRWWFGSKPKQDFVQVEIESALDLGVPIVPLLVDGVAMPHVDELPNSMAEFVLLNAAPIRSGRDFHKDMDQLLKTIVSWRERGISFKEE